MKPLFRILPAGSPVTVYFNDADIYYTGIEAITGYAIFVDMSKTEEWKKPWDHFQRSFPEQSFSIIFNKKHLK